MGIFKNAVYSKIDVFVKFESAINLEIKVQIKKKSWIPFTWVTRITYMYSLYLTIAMIIIKYCMYVCCWNKCENVHSIFNFIFFNPICEKTRNNTLLNFLYALDLSFYLRPFLDKILKKNQNIHSGQNSR